MTKFQQNIFDIVAGDDCLIPCTVAGKTLTGSTIKWRLYRDAETILDKTEVSGITISGEVFTVTLSKIETAGLLGTYFHESEVTDTTGKVSTVAHGSFKVLPSHV